MIDQINELPEDGLNFSRESSRYIENTWISRKNLNILYFLTPYWYFKWFNSENWSLILRLGNFKKYDCRMSRQISYLGWWRKYSWPKTYFDKSHKAQTSLRGCAKCKCFIAITKHIPVNQSLLQTFCCDGQHVMLRSQNLVNCYRFGNFTLSVGV